MTVENKGRKRKRPCDLPPLQIPPPEVRCIETETPACHPNVFWLSKEEKQWIDEAKLVKLDDLKQHYLAISSPSRKQFVKFFYDKQACEQECALTKLSGQYLHSDGSVEIDKQKNTKLWKLSVPYLSPRAWKTLDQYQKHMPKVQEEDDRDGMIGSFIKAFWRAAEKLVNRNVIHLDLVHNAKRNIMIRETSKGIEEVKIVDYGLSKIDRDNEETVPSYYNMILHNLLECIYDVHLLP